jgi:hypothetical protein
MGANDVLALDANFRNWCSNRMSGLKREIVPFEYYCAEHYLKPYGVSDEEILSGLVGGHHDGGIDGMYFFANRRLVEEDTEIDPKTVSKLNLMMIQAKEGDGFSPTAVSKMIFFVDDLLDLGKSEQRYHAKYSKRVVEAMKVFKQKYQTVIGESPALGIEVLYISKQDVEPNEDCIRAADKLKDTVKRHFGAARCDLSFINAQRLWAQVQLRPRRNKALQWATQPLETPEGFVGLVKLNDYFDFLRDEHGELQERIFESNVRGFWPNTPVNAGIKKTLQNPSQADFWLLNNGVTILAASSSPAGTYKLLINDPQIVNGLQTSRQVYNYYSGLPAVPSDEKRRVLVRVIHAPDKSVRDEVIRATNSQNKMPDEALRATDPIHRQIETLFQQFGLFYDRRKGQCKDEGKPIAQIVSVLELLQAMLAIVLKRPDEARARPRNYIKDEKLYTSVFGQDTFQLPVYLKTALLQRRVDDFIDGIRLAGERLSYFHQRNVKFYMSMYAACAATKDAYAPPGSLLELDPSALPDSLLQDCWERVFDNHYKKLTEQEYPDVVAKGPNFLKAINTELRRRFAKRKRRQKVVVVG